MKTYSKVKMLATLPKPSIKNINIPVGDEITVLEVVNDERSTADLNLDYLLAKLPSGSLIKIGIGEYARMAIVGGGATFESEEADDVEIHEKFKIASSEDRTNASGVVYPGPAYRGYDDMVAKARKGEEVDWRSLSSTGLKSDNGGYKPVQNYTIEVIA